MLVWGQGPCCACAGTWCRVTEVLGLTGLDGLPRGFSHGIHQETGTEEAEPGQRPPQDRQPRTAAGGLHAGLVGEGGLGAEGLQWELAPSSPFLQDLEPGEKPPLQRPPTESRRDTGPVAPSLWPLPWSAGGTVFPGVLVG